MSPHWICGLCGAELSAREHICDFKRDRYVSLVRSQAKRIREQRRQLAGMQRAVEAANAKAKEASRREQNIANAWERFIDEALQEIEF